MPKKLAQMRIIDKSTPKSRDATKTKARILQFGFIEFASHGFDGARMDRIVKAAEVNISLVYQYFGSKENLYIAVMEQAYDIMRASHRDFDVQHLAPKEAMESLIRWTFRIFVNQPELISLLNSENDYRGKHIAKSQHIRDLYNPLIATLNGVLKRGAEDGLFRSNVNPESLFISMNGMGYFYLSNKYTLGVILRRDLMDSKALKLHEDHMVSVVLGFLRA
jgi:TetR/AcrR family transcriptional regulator